jgi:hypothetical protein
MSSIEILDRITEWLREKDFIVRKENSRLIVDVQHSDQSVSLREISIIGSKDYNTIALGFRYDMDDDTCRAYMYLNSSEKVAFIERIENMFKTIGVAALFIPNAGSMQNINGRKSDSYRKPKKRNIHEKRTGSLCSSYQCDNINITTE